MSQLPVGRSLPVSRQDRSMIQSLRRSPYDREILRIGLPADRLVHWSGGSRRGWSIRRGGTCDLCRGRRGRSGWLDRLQRTTSASLWNRDGCARECDHLPSDQGTRRPRPARDPRRSWCLSRHHDTRAPHVVIPLGWGLVGVWTGIVVLMLVRAMTLRWWYGFRFAVPGRDPSPSSPGA